MDLENHANRAVREVLQRMVANGDEIGVQVAAYLHGEKIVDAWAGMADPATERAVDGDTLSPQRRCMSRQSGASSTTIARWRAIGPNMVLTARRP